MQVQRLVVFCLLQLAAAFIPNAYPEEDGVLLLDSANFQAALQKFDPLLVEFHAPWCGHCKALAPEWTKAAASLKALNSSFTLAKVDVTIAVETAATYKINSYPTIKMFRGGKDSDYTGGRTEVDIVSWVNKKSRPAFHVINAVEELKKYQEKHASFVLGIYTDLKSAHAMGYQHMATLITDDGDIVHAITTNAGVRSHIGVVQDTIVVLKTFDEGRNDLAVADGDAFDLSSIREFILTSSTPLIQSITHTNAKRIVQTSPVKKHLMVFSDPLASYHTALLEEIRPVAEALRGQVLTLTVAPTEKRVLDFFGVTADDFPTIYVVDQRNPNGMKKYSIASQSSLEGGTAEGGTAGGAVAGVTSDPLINQLHSTRVLAFAKDVLDGKIKPAVKSEESQPEDTEGGVAVLRGSSFRQLVIDNDKDVFVEFYAPWCGQCKKLAPVWDQLGARYKRQKQHIIIAAMDTATNDVPDDTAGVVVKGFPSLYFFPGNNKDKPVKYEGKRDLSNLVTFLKSSSTHRDINHHDEL